MIENKQGWIKHDGDSIPVAHGVIVDVKYKGGELCPYVDSTCLEWWWGQEEMDEYDILEYRLLEGDSICKCGEPFLDLTTFDYGTGQRECKLCDNILNIV